MRWKCTIGKYHAFRLGPGSWLLRDHSWSGQCSPSMQDTLASIRSRLTAVWVWLVLTLWKHLFPLAMWLQSKTTVVNRRHSLEKYLAYLWRFNRACVLNVATFCRGKSSWQSGQGISMNTVVIPLLLVRWTSTYTNVRNTERTRNAFAHSGGFNICLNKQWCLQILRIGNPHGINAYLT